MYILAWHNIIAGNFRGSKFLQISPSCEMFNNACSIYNYAKKNCYQEGKEVIVTRTIIISMIGLRLG